MRASRFHLLLLALCCACSGPDGAGDASAVDASADSPADALADGRGDGDGGPPIRVPVPPLPAAEVVVPPVDAAAGVVPPPPGAELRLPHVEVVDVEAWRTIDLPQRPNDTIGNGWGFGLVDADGDLDLDVFLAGTTAGPPACLFANISTPGDVQFDPRPVQCLRDVDVISASAVEVDGDDRHELLLGTLDGPLLLRFAPEPAIVALPTGDVPCVVSNALSVDLDRDGLPDLVAGCETVREVGRRSRVADAAWLQGPDGWVSLDEPALTDSNTLALGLVDRDDDGLLDIAVVSDTLSSSTNRNVQEDPGGWLRRCGPSEDCRFERTPFTDDLDAWGSFMGFGVVALQDDAPHFVLTDWGGNRLLPLGETGPDAAVGRGVSLRSLGDIERFHWAALVDDFDLDGDDDLFITQGTVPFTPESAAAAHFDVLLAQQDDGTFLPLSDGIGIPSLSGLGPDGSVYRSRGAVRADLDGDGSVEVIIAPLVGRYRVLRVSAPAETDGGRCTLVPRARYGGASRGGWAIAETVDGPWFRRDVAGQHQAGTSPFALTSFRRGLLRFASGAVVPFDCPDAGPLVVEEPEWLAVSWGDRTVELVVDESVRGPTERVRVAVQTANRVLTRESSPTPGGYEAPLDVGATAVMWELDGRWVDAWFVR